MFRQTTARPDQETLLSTRVCCTALAVNNRDSTTTGPMISEYPVRSKVQRGQEAAATANERVKSADGDAYDSAHASPSNADA